MKIKLIAKHKIYPVFQFLAFSALLCFVIALLIFYSYTSDPDSSNAKIILRGGSSLNVGRAFVFGYAHSTAGGFFISFFLYVGIIFELISYSCVLFVAQHKDRNFYDSLFLLFFMIPLLSNAITLAAQISKNKVFAELEVDEEKIYDEIKLEFNKHRLEELTNHSLILEADKSAVIENIRNAENSKQVIKSGSKLSLLSRAELRIALEKARTQAIADKLAKKIAKKARKEKSEKKDK